MKKVTCIDIDGLTYHVPLSKITIEDQSSDEWTVYKYRITFDGKTFDISKKDYDQIFAFMMSNDEFKILVVVKLGDRL